MPQACRLFTKGFATFCTSAGLEQSDMEPCLWTQTKKRYSYTYPNGRTTYTATDDHDGMTGVEVEPYRIFLLHHVDDILCASSANNPFYDKFVTDLNTRYSTTGGNSTDIFFLNQEINVSETGIQLSHTFANLSTTFLVLASNQALKRPHYQPISLQPRPIAHKLNLNRNKIWTFAKNTSQP